MQLFTKIVPLLFFAQIFLQETLNPKVVDLIGQGIISVAILVIWFYTFRQSSKQQDDANKRYEQLAIQNSEMVRKLFEYIKADTEYKSLLTGLLTRSDDKHDQMIKLLERGKN